MEFLIENFVQVKGERRKVKGFCPNCLNFKLNK
jgi:hypothetical protein